MSCPKFPEVRVALSGEDGNIFFIVGRATAAMKKAGIAEADRNQLRGAVIAAGSYDEALQIVMRTVETY